MKLFNRIGGTGPLYDGMDALACCQWELDYYHIAIEREVSTALGDDTLVRPIPPGGLNAS